MDSVLWSIGGFVVAIAVLVTFHEFGHFWVARKLGVKVTRFSVGFGRALWRHVGRDGVEYVVAAIPLGGYVKMVDEREGEVATTDLSGAFNRQPLWKRAAIVVAGPGFNFILAILLYWVVWVGGMPALKPITAAPLPASAAALAGIQAQDHVVSVDGRPVRTWQGVQSAILEHALSEAPLKLTVLTPAGSLRQVSVDMKGLKVGSPTFLNEVGLQPYMPPIPAVLSEVMPDTPARHAGLEVGDRITAVNGRPIRSWQELVPYIEHHAGHTVSVTVQRAGRTLTLPLHVGQKIRNGQVIGFMGAGVTPPGNLFDDMRTTRRRNPLAAVPAALNETWGVVKITFESLYRVVTGTVPAKELSGPIMIAKIAGRSAHAGWADFLSFLAFVSVNLGILNLFPVPVLDGGHLLYLGAEAVRHRPLSVHTQEMGLRLGFALLAALMVLVFYNDIARLVG